MYLAFCRIALILCLLVTLLVPISAADKEPASKEKLKKANRLAKESSPYLLQHAHNPVDWYPWGPEAFAKAKKENKLVFLSIGYSSCHWCHVMEKESFSHEDVAKILNKHFVCIKVDREERPDIDQIYLTALNVLGNRGGWPLSMWLTADGRPIVGGTYWPREDKKIDGEEERGFKTLLGIMQKFHEEKPKELEAQADKTAKATKEALVGAARGLAIVPLDRKLIDAGVEELEENFDKLHGGFGNAARNFKGTKFPMPPNLLFLQTEAIRKKSKSLDRIVRITLDRMARGGIYDHLGGGFARYSTERTWTVPHFEKMLYDNGQLLEVYALAHRKEKAPFTERVLRQTVEFIGRELTAPEGGFYSALDADSEGEEGRFYVWTTKEIDEVLTDKEDNAFFKRTYGVDEGVNFEEKYHILRLPITLAERAEGLKLTEEQLEARLVPLRKKLFDVRAKRPRPFLDTKVLTAWNGLAIAGMARAGQALEDKAITARATRAADFLLTNMRTGDGRLLRSWGAAPGEKPTAKLNAYLDDYAYLTHGLLTLHDVTGDRRWHDAARQLADKMIELFADKELGGFFYTSNDHEKLFARSKDQYDGAQPSGNSMAVRVLIRLWQTTGEESYGKLAEKSFKSLAGPLKTNASSMSGLAECLALFLDIKEAKEKKK